MERIDMRNDRGTTTTLVDVCRLITEGDLWLAPIIARTVSFGLFAVSAAGSSFIALFVDVSVEVRVGMLVGVYLDLPLSASLAAFTRAVTNHN